MTYAERMNSRRTRFWKFVLDFMPQLGHPARNPLWHIAFSYWDDAAGCGCWREIGPHRRRWQGAPRRQPDVS